MPLYDYKCGTCRENFEVLQSIKDPIPPCPRCGEAVDVVKELTTGSFKFDGGSPTGSRSGV